MLDQVSHGAVTELRLNKPPVNALGPELIRHLRETFEGIDPSEHGAIVLSGSPGIFSGGLDVPALLQLDRDGIRAVWQDLFGLLGAVARCPVPTVAAITGHCPAGGAVVSLFCDYRIMARAAEGEKSFRIGLNEVQVGLIVPEPIQKGLVRLIGPRRAEQLMVAAYMPATDEAVSIGLVDEAAPVDAVVERAVAWCNQRLELPREAMLKTREIARRDLHELFADPERLPLDDFAEHWVSAETQANLKALVERLAKG